MKAEIVTHFRLRNTYRLIPSRFPSVGILDRVAAPDDLDAVIELESWTNDRISEELGILHRLPQEEWVVGQPMATVVMASFCHPRPEGGRFNTGDRGAWYAATTLDTAHAEVVHHRAQELEEIGVFETHLEMRAYLADFRTDFHDLRAGEGTAPPSLYSKTSYTASQRLAEELLTQGSNGVVYDSVRLPGGTCLACFRPPLVKNVRASAHYEYRWSGSRNPAVRRLG